MTAVQVFLVDPPIWDTDRLNEAIIDRSHPMHKAAAMWHRLAYRGVYEPALNYRCAIDFEMPERVDDRSVCETAFYEFNVGDGPFARQYRRVGNRSLSVGDVVVVDGRAWLCASFGWERLVDWKLQ